MCIRLILTLVVLVSFYQVVSAEELIQAPAAIQISSTVSDGKYSISKIAEAARQNNIKVVVLTDRDFMRWQYGLSPLRRIIKRTIETRSVATYGIKRYLKEIEEVQKRYPDLVLIPGVESAPFYYWSGSPFKGNLIIHNWHKHMLVVGMDEPEDYKNIPSVSNPWSLKLPFNIKKIYRLWPILFLLIGIFCQWIRKYRYKDWQGHSLGPYSFRWRICGAVFVVLGLLFLYNNLPLWGVKYDQYGGDLGIMPYQNLIDYVNSRGGLIFWAHPEAENIDKRGEIGIETREYSSHLLQSHGYVGFTVFYEGFRKVGCPGGIWDEVLKEYCLGERKAPVWAISGLGYDYQIEDINEYMKKLRTILLIPRLNKIEVLKALREGKMYVVQGKPDEDLILDKFIIKDSLSDNEGTIADEIDLKGNPILKISGYFVDEQIESSGKIRLIRNGNIVNTFEVTSPFEIEYQDDYFAPREKIYYRLEIRYAGKIIITNPIFVRFKL